MVLGAFCYSATLCFVTVSSVSLLVSSSKRSKHKKCWFEWFLLEQDPKCWFLTRSPFPEQKTTTKQWEKWKFSFLSLFACEIIVCLFLGKGQQHKKLHVYYICSFLIQLLITIVKFKIAKGREVKFILSAVFHLCFRLVVVVVVVVVVVGSVGGGGGGMCVCVCVCVCACMSMCVCVCVWSWPKGLWLNLTPSLPIGKELPIYV